MSVKNFMEIEKKWDFSSNAGFAVLNIEKLKKHIEHECGNNCNIIFKESGLPHCSGFFYGDEMTLLKLLAQLSHALYYVKDLP